MRFSASSLFITLCISFLLILLLDILLSYKKSYKLFRTDFITVLVVVVVVRMFVPLEFKFTKTIIVPTIMNPIIVLLQYKIYANVQVYQFLLLVWALGIIWNLIKWIRAIQIAKDMYKRIENHSEHYHISDFIDNYQEENYVVLKTNYVSSPMVMGFNKTILIPDVYLSQENLKNILLHETWHIKNHDVCTKQIINLLVIMYWWFIPVYRLRDKIDLFLEMRVDNQTTNPFSKEEVMKYMHTLIEIQKNIQGRNEFKRQSTHFMIQDNAHVLEYRINYLMDGMYRKKTSKILMIVVLTLPLLTNSIILESEFDSPNSKEIYDQSDIDKGYIIKHKDGTYELVFGKKRVEISNPKIECFKDIPIIEE